MSISGLPQLSGGNELTFHRATFYGLEKGFAEDADSMALIALRSCPFIEVTPSMRAVPATAEESF